MNILSKLFGLLLAASAHTYVLPADFILQEMAKRKVCGVANLMGSITEGGETKFAKFRLTSREIIADMATDDEPHAATSPRSLSLKFVQNLIGCASTEKVLSDIDGYLNNLAVDRNIVTHSIFDYEPVLIIGAEDGPQLWVEKKSFLPIKEVATSSVTTFKGWQALNAVKGASLPRLINTVLLGFNHSITIAEDGQ